MRCVYCISCKNPEIKQVYIGCTKNLTNRIYQHTVKSKVYPNRKLYKFIKDNGDWNNWEYKICKVLKNKDDGFFFERQYIDENNNTLNLSLPYLTENERLNYHKNYREKNKEKIKIYKKEYRKKRFNCACGAKVCFNNKTAHFKTKKHINYVNKNNINI